MLRSGKKLFGTLYFLAGIFFPQTQFAAPPPAGFYHIAPSHWYTGFKDSSLEIIIHAENADLLEFDMERYEGVELVGKSNSANRHIAYLQLLIHKNASPGLLQFSAKPISRRVRYVKPFRFTYLLMARSPRLSNLRESDIIYRIMLDRFSNGNDKNDRTPLKNAYDFNRNDPTARHGGDVTGLLNGLDYFNELGTSALWLNQLQEDDAKSSSYLGRSITDHYSIDPRYGNNATLLLLKEQLASKHLKLCLDLDLNQVGWFHWMHLNFDTGWFHDPDSSVYPLPDADYLNDPGLSDNEKKWIASHCMDPAIPDFNQDNPHIARFLKQSCIWWTEYMGVAAWFIPDPHLLAPGFLDDLTTDLRAEFPGLPFIADTKTSGIVTQAGYVSNTINPQQSAAFDGISNFALHKTLSDIAASDTCDNRFLNELFNQLSLNSVYDFPAKNINFLDDINGPRTIEKCRSDLARSKMLTALIFCLPGATSILYGAELALQDATTTGNPLPDFPACNQKNLLNCLRNLPANQKDAFHYTKGCIAMRNKNAALIYGTTHLFAPASGLFSFLRIYQDKKILVMVNDNQLERTILTKRYEKEIRGYSGIKNLLTGEMSLLSDFLVVPAHSTLVYELIP